MQTTMTYTMDFEGMSIELDFEYAPNTDEVIRDIDLAFVWINRWADRKNQSYNILDGLDREAVRIIEKNILAIPGLEKELCEKMEQLGDYLGCDPDTFVKEY